MSGVKRFLVRCGRLYSRHCRPIAFIARRFIKSLSAKPEGGVCVDIGGGTTPYRGIIESVFAPDQYVSVDISPSDTTSVAADAAALPFVSESVDMVVSFDVIQHIPHSAGALDEMVRVLCKEGSMIMTFPFLYGECDVHDFRRWTIEGMVFELESRGMVIEKVTRRGGLFFVLACLLNGAIQHMVPGQRASWRREKNAKYIGLTIVTTIVTFPVLLVQWFSLLVDHFLPGREFYMGGILYARKK